VAGTDQGDAAHQGGRIVKGLKARLLVMQPLLLGVFVIATVLITEAGSKWN
jgi:hypothetical protein